MTASGDETFLSRWSRRKRDGEDLRPEPTHKSPDQPALEKADVDEPEIDLATLPKIEDLTANSDFSAFLKKGVPEYLKQRALRQAWSLDPQIRDFIEVAENQYNYNIPGGVPGYGDLPEGIDMRALLAQAIGLDPDAKRAPQEAPVAVIEPAPEAATTLADAPVGSVPRDASNTDQSDSSELAKAEAPEEKPASPQEIADAREARNVEIQTSSHRAGRRRHGGALPDHDLQS